MFTNNIQLAKFHISPSTSQTDERNLCCTPHPPPPRRGPTRFTSMDIYVLWIRFIYFFACLKHVICVESCENGMYWWNSSADTLAADQKPFHNEARRLVRKQASIFLRLPLSPKIFSKYLSTKTHNYKRKEKETTTTSPLQKEKQKTSFLLFLIRW